MASVCRPVVILLVAASSARPPVRAARRQHRGREGIVGTYTVNGVDPDDIEYSGTVTIVAADAADAYVVEWIVTGTIQQGSASWPAIGSTSSGRP